MKTLYCTYFDKNYLPRGLALLESLYAYDPEVRVTVLCLDSLTQVLLKQLNLPGVRLLSLDGLEKRYPELKTVKTTRSLVEYYWTLTPVLLLHLLREEAEGDAAVYLDADQLFFSSPAAISEEVRNHDITLQPHNFPERTREEKLPYGRYNVGVLGARNTDAGREVIGWWRKRCLEWCYACEDDKTRYGDQKYLDHFAEHAPGVCEFQNPGIGVAPWNHENASFSRDGAENILFGESALVVYHFHSLAIVHPDIVLPSKYDSSYLLSEEVIRHCYVPYLAALDRAFARLRTLDPSFSFGMSDDRVDENTPLLVRTSQVDALCAGLPHARYALGEFTYLAPVTPARWVEGKRQGNLWEGDYGSWEEAEQAATGYDSEEIVNKAVAAARLVRDGKAVCERDTVVLPDRQYLWPTLSGVLLGAARNGGEVHLVDFGGALGSTYRTILPFLWHLKKVRWHVVELPHMAQAGKREFQTEQLLFHDSLKDCLDQYRVDGILLGAVLQYLPDPYGFLDALTNMPFDYVIFDRTSFNPGKGERICVQRVPEWIYSASYPCRMLDYGKCLALLAQRYDIADVMPSMEGSIDGIDFKGLVAVARAGAVALRDKEQPEPAGLFRRALAAWEADPALPRRLNLGCGSRFLPDWLNMDFTANAPHVFGWNLRNGIPLPDNFVDAVYHSNVIEHFTRDDARAFMLECLRVLKPGGILRIAAPDLEGGVREYLANLEKARVGNAQGVARYEWSVVELLDQLVRHRSGGEMLRYWAEKDVPAEDYVLQRVGTEYINARKQLLRNPPNLNGPDPDAASVGAFRLGGEVHQWMYDSYSLRKLMESCGVSDVRDSRYAESAIPGFSESLLEKNADGGVYKPDSFYLEGKKALSACQSDDVLPVSFVETSGDAPHRPAPIAVFAYNRPCHLRQTLEALAANELARESDVIIYCDGPKPGADRSAVDATRAVAHAATGFASVTVHEHSQNKGLGGNIIAGVTEVIAQYGRTIVLEDDLVTSPYFLRYMNDGLAMYRDNPQVASIHGWCFPHVVPDAPQTFFVRGADCLGWATWKRAWDVFEPDAAKLLFQIRAQGLENEFNASGSYNYTGLLENQLQGKVSSWAVRWHAAMFLQRMYTLYPGTSLVSHKGGDGSGTNVGVNDSFDSPLAEKRVTLFEVSVGENAAMRGALNAFFWSLKSAQEM